MDNAINFDELHAGAAAFAALIGGIARQTDQDFADCEYCRSEELVNDVRDYASMARLVEQSITENYVTAAPKHREGFLRALTDLLSIITDGCAPDFKAWTPIETTAHAFAAPDVARDLLASVRMLPPGYDACGSEASHA